MTLRQLNTCELQAKILDSHLLGLAAQKRAMSLVEEQFLLLRRNPYFGPNCNPRAGHNRILVVDVTNEPIGYVEQSAADIIAPRIDKGEMWVARVSKPAQVLDLSTPGNGVIMRVSRPQVRLWCEPALNNLRMNFTKYGMVPDY